MSSRATRSSTGKRASPETVDVSPKKRAKASLGSIVEGEKAGEQLAEVSVNAREQATESSIQSGHETTTPASTSKPDGSITPPHEPPATNDLPTAIPDPTSLTEPRAADPSAPPKVPDTEGLPKFFPNFPIQAADQRDKLYWEGWCEIESDPVSLFVL